MPLSEKQSGQSVSGVAGIVAGSAIAAVLGVWRIIVVWSKFRKYNSSPLQANEPILLFQPKECCDEPVETID